VFKVNLKMPLVCIGLPSTLKGMKRHRMSWFFAESFVRSLTVYSC
jgi:hypothetical protein